MSDTSDRNEEFREGEDWDEAVDEAALEDEEEVGLAASPSIALDESAVNIEETFAQSPGGNHPLYHLELPYSHETFFAAYRGETIEAGRMVVVSTRYGKDLARVKKVIKNAPPVPRMVWIIRPAMETDLAKDAANRAQEDNAFNVCRQRIEMHGLAMRLVSAHYVLEEAKIVFFFTSEARVDFRDLVRDLTGVFHARVDLRQIGQRDPARICGGLGVCGREVCCHSFAANPAHVTTKMAKDQELSLMKISGPCGKLLCCLAYEHEFYAAERKFVPHQGSKVLYHGEMWRVSEANVLLGVITMTQEGGGQVKLNKNCFSKVDTRWIARDPEPGEKEEEAKNGE